MTVLAVIVAHNSAPDLPACLSSLRAPEVSAVVVDNGSTDDSAAVVRAAHPWAGMLRQENLGFAHACNRGARHAPSDHLLFLNPDAELRPGALATLLAVLEARGDVAAVGPRTLSGDLTPQVSFGPRLKIGRASCRERVYVLV